MPTDYTALTVGEPFYGKVPPNPPLCRDGHGVCQFFRLMVTTGGVLTVAMTYDPRQQPSQAIDLSVITPEGEIWADGIELRTRAQQGQDYYVTVWYALPGAEFLLLATISSD